MSNNSIPIKKSKISGLNSGFWLDLFFNSRLDDVSLMIYIHNHTQIPATIFNKGHYIQSGSRNYFNIKRTIDQKLEFPYNNCFKNVSESKYNQTIIDYLKEKKRQYTQKECLNLCRNLKYQELNSCNFTIDNLDKDIIDNAYNNLTNLTIIIKCVEESFNELIENDLCSDANYCPLECDSFKYEIIIKIQ